MITMNTPNRLTISRMVMVPFFVAFMLTGHNVIAGFIFIIASLTDTLDGYLARKNNQITVFGKFMDPLADKLLVCSALICLTVRANNPVPAWIVIIIIAREFIISGFRLIAAQKGVVIAANFWGKAKTVSQMVMVILKIFDFGGFPGLLGEILMWTALVLTVISLVTYMKDNISVLYDVD